MVKDITEKQLESFPDVGADIINGLCFAGKQEVCPEEVQVISEQVAIREDTGKYHSRIRDVLYQIDRLGICVAYIGIENQSGVDNIMPLRVMGMDYGKYVMQINRFQAENRKQKIPVYTKSIRDDQKLIPVISFVLNLYQKFRSDFRIVIQYLHAKGNPDEMKAFCQSSQKLLYPRELLDTLHGLGWDNRYLKIKKEVMDLEKEEIAMYEILDYCENKGVERGIKIGKEEGKAQGIISTAYSLGASREWILNCLCTELCVSMAKAKEYMNMYGKSLLCKVQ